MMATGTTSVNAPTTTAGTNISVTDKKLSPAQQIAAIIRGMIYADLRELGRELCDMHSDSSCSYDLDESRDWAEFLHAWADSQ